jgi:hypothetical protein
MRRWLKHAGALLIGLALMVSITVWFLPPSRTSVEQKRHEDALLGTTLEQVQVFFGGPPDVRWSEQDVQASRAKGTHLPEEESTLAFWTPGPLGRHGDVVLVAFDKMGTAKRVGFLDGTISLSRQIRGWLPF